MARRGSAAVITILKLLDDTSMIFCVADLKAVSRSACCKWRVSDSVGDLLSIVGYQSVAAVG